MLNREFGLWSVFIMIIGVIALNWAIWLICWFFLQMFKFADWIIC